MKPIKRSYDHLKRHVPTNLALILALLSAAMPVLGATFILVPHGYAASRSNPLYWLLMAPLAVWVWGAISFDAWAIRLVAPLLIAAPLVAAALAALSYPTNGDAVALWVLAVISLLASIIGAAALRRSPLWPFGSRLSR